MRQLAVAALLLASAAYGAESWDFDRSIEEMHERWEREAQQRRIEEQERRLDQLEYQQQEAERQERLERMRGDDRNDDKRLPWLVPH